MYSITWKCKRIKEAWMYGRGSALANTGNPRGVIRPKWLHVLTLTTIAQF